MVVVDGQIAIVEVAHQRRPAAQAVLDGFRRRGAIGHLAALAGEPLPERLGDGLRALLPQLSAAVGVELLLPGFALDVVQRGEVASTPPRRCRCGDWRTDRGTSCARGPCSRSRSRRARTAPCSRSSRRRRACRTSCLGTHGRAARCDFRQSRRPRPAAHRIRCCCSSTDRPGACGPSPASASAPASHRRAALLGSAARLSAHRPAAEASRRRHPTHCASVERGSASPARSKMPSWR